MDWEVCLDLDTSRLAFASLRESRPYTSIKRGMLPLAASNASSSSESPSSGDMRPTHDDGGSVGGKCQPITFYFGLLHLQP